MGLRIDMGFGGPPPRPPGIPEEQRREVARRFAGIPEYEPPRAGFGKDTVNLTGAALQTLGVNFSNSRRVVQAAQELRDAARERVAAEQRNAARQREVLDRLEIRKAARVAARDEANAREVERVNPADTRREVSADPPPRPEPPVAAGQAPPGSSFDISV